MNQLSDKLEKIETREDFLIFYQEYLKYYEEEKDSWENNNLDLFLTAIDRVVFSIEGYYDNFNINHKKLSQWRVFADILMASAVYE